MRELTGPENIVWAVTFVPGDPPRLAAAVQTGVFVWDLRAPAEPARFLPFRESGRMPVLTAAASGRWLVTGLAEVLDVWDLKGEPKSTSVKAPGLLAARCVDQELHWVSTQKGGLSVGSIDLAARDRRKQPLAPVALDAPADMEAGLRGADLDRVFRLRPVTDLSADGRRVAMSGFVKVVHLWDAETGAVLGEIPFRGFPCAVSFAPDGSRLAVDGQTTVYVHDAGSLELAVKWKVNPCDTPVLAWSPDGRLLARADNSTTVRVYDPATGRQVCALGEKRGRQVCVAFAPDGLTFAAGTWDGPVRVWDVEEG